MTFSVYGESARIMNQDSNGFFANSILQTLNRDIGGAYYAEEAFNPADFEGVPIVYASEHPDPFKNLADELKRVGGQIVGKLSNVRIVRGGTTRLVAGMNINNAEALSLWRQGKLSLSTGLLAVKNAEGRITKITKAHHVLIFKEGDGVGPKDKSVLITNQEVNYMDELSYDPVNRKWGNSETVSAVGNTTMATVAPQEKENINDLINRLKQPAPVRCYETMAYHELEAAAGYNRTGALTNSEGEEVGLAYDPIEKKWV
ncbi:hypothetical protein [Methanocella sp. MCL-LM]|uniref:hypothetical protein n=1 Tax=Methanocella sp. MCL-LM TaxID=3412035 RepID=UPI003C73C3EF